MSPLLNRTRRCRQDTSNVKPKQRAIFDANEADEVLEDNEEFHLTKLYKPRAYNRNFTVS